MKEKNNLTKENKRKATVLLIIGALVLIVLVAGSTYAYFRAQVGNGTSADINATTGTVDDLRFEKGEDLTFRADMTNFAEGKGNVEGSTTSKAILTANNATNSAKEDYYVYVNIITNEIEYTSYKKDTEIKVFKTKEEKEKEVNTLEGYTARPELILTITGPDDKIVGSGDSLYKIEGLDYYDNITTKVNESDEGQKVSGYDITETTGLIKIELKEKSGLGEGYNYSVHIETDAGNNTNGKIPYQTTQEWEVKVTFINLDSDQNLNTNKSFNGEVLLQKNQMSSSYVTTCSADTAACQIAKKSLEDNTIVYHNGSMQDPELLYNGYKIADNHKDSYDALYAEYNDDLNKRYIIRFKCNDIEQYSNSYCSSTSSNYYYLDYNEEEHYDTFKEALQQAVNDNYVEIKNLDAEDYSYRYTGGEYDVAPAYKNDYKTIIDIIGYVDDYRGGGNDNSYLYYKQNPENTFSVYTNETNFINYGLENGYIVEKSINNYICFDESENGECNEDDLYRIIGIFPTNDKKDEYEIKVIKDTPATKEQLGEEGAYAKCDYDDSCKNYYYWNSSKGTSYESANTRNWRDSNLNKENLNGYFWNTYLTEHNPTLKNIIADHTWIVGGIDKSTTIAKDLYDEEIGINKRKEGDSGCFSSENEARSCIEEDLIYPYAGLDNSQITKIGLMYVSDYCYTFNNYDCYGKKYGNYEDMDLTFLETWLNEDSSYSHRINLYLADTFTVKPVFYLKSSVKLTSGDGSKESPYRLSRS